MQLLACVIIAAAFIATGAYAEQQPSDQEIATTFTGKKVAWGKGGIADYKADGNYEFFYGSTARGKYYVKNGRICVDFVEGWKRCDKIKKDDAGYYMIDREGNQFRAVFR